MKVTLISTFDRQGGAATAAFRHVSLLRAAGVDARMVVRSKTSDVPFIQSARQGWLSEPLDQFREWGERLTYAAQAADREQWFYFSLDRWGERIDHHPWVREADVIHLHWFHKGFLSLHSLENLARLGKPMVWQLHDMWAFTGGCHYAGSCRAFTRQCGQCPFLRHPGPADLSHRIWKRKTRTYPQLPLSIVTCSQWLADEARQSSLLHQVPVTTIANGIDTAFYSPGDPREARRRLDIPESDIRFLFVAMNNREKRKGFRELIDALHRVAAHLDSDTLKGIQLTVLGKTDPELLAQLPLPVHQLGFRSSPEDIRDAYRSADYFILPSLEDNLPNTVMEAQSCGCPTIAFRTGGVPEMIDHLHSGYLADHGSSESLSEGILHAIRLHQEGQSTWKELAREKILRNYSYEVIAGHYLTHYSQLLESPPRG